MMAKQWFVEMLVLAVTALVWFMTFTSAAAASAASLPAGRIIDDHTIEVSTYEELTGALRDERYTDIYFANDITAVVATSAERQAVIHAGKRQQHIYSHAYEGNERFTFTQADSNDIGDTIRVLKGSAVTEVTVSDMNIIGRNYYGIVQVEESMTEVVTCYDKITYTGPQPVHNRGGKVQFGDVEITIAPGWQNSSGEIAEAYDIEFTGKAVVDTNVSGNGDAVFWLTRSNDQSGSFRVKTGADVRVQGNSYLFYTAGNEHYSPDLYFEPGSSFRAVCGQGFMAQYVNRLEVAEGAQVSFIQTGAATDYGLRIREELVVGAAAIFEVQRYAGGGAALQVYNAGRVIFDDPERVVVYAHNALLAGFSTSNSRVNITTDALNLWQSAPDDAPAGEPSRIWNKAGAEKLTVAAVWLGNSPASTSSNLDTATDPVTEDISNDTFLLRSSQLMVLGRLNLAIDAVTESDEVVTGYTVPEAILSGSYTTREGLPATAAEQKADAEGAYSLLLGSEKAQPDSRLYVTADSNRLRMRQYTVVAEQRQVLAFLSVPELWFEITTLPTEPAVVKRKDPDWTVIVQDTRKDSSGFRVDVRVDAPLAADQNAAVYEIPGGLIFRDHSGSWVPLSEHALTVYSADSDRPGIHAISWAADQGFLVQVVPGEHLRSEAEYTTTIYWSLISAP